jgi:hypothetical protein
MKLKLLILLAMGLANMAVVADGITHKPFIRGLANRGTPVWSTDLIGATWRDGDETAFAGLRLLPTVEWVTGP